MNRLKQLRQEKKLLQSDIAKIIKRTDRAVGQYEREERDPGSKTWSTLADYFNVSVDYLLGKTNIRNSGEQIDDILNEAMIGMSRDDYNKLTDKQKEAIRNFAKTIRDLGN